MHSLGPRRLVEGFVLAQVAYAAPSPSAGDAASVGSADDGADTFAGARALFKHVHPPPRARESRAARSRREMRERVELFCVPAPDVCEPHRPAVFSFVLTDAFGNKLFVACLVDTQLRVEPSSASTTGNAAAALGEGIHRSASALNATRRMPSSASSLGAGDAARSGSSPAIVISHTSSEPPAPRLSGVVCLASTAPVTTTLELLLWELHQLLRRPGASPLASAERFLLRLYHETLLPRLSPAIDVSITLAETQRQWTLSAMHCDTRLPYVDARVSLLFDRLGPGSLLRVLSGLLVEESALVFSESYLDLTQVCESLGALLLPFEWRMVYVPVLPAPLAEQVTSVSVVFMGLSSAAVAEHLDAVSPQVLRVCLDDEQVWSSDAPLLFPHAARTLEALRQLERRWRVALSRRAEAAGAERQRVDAHMDVHLLPETRAFVNDIRTLILDDVFCYLLANVSRHLGADGTFDTAAFVCSFPESERRFVKRFAETSMFSEFKSRRPASPDDGFQPSLWLGFGDYLRAYNLRRGVKDPAGPPPPLPAVVATLSLPPRDGEQSIERLLEPSSAAQPPTRPACTLSVDALLLLTELERHPMKNLLDQLEPLARAHPNNLDVRWLRAVAFENADKWIDALLEYAHLLHDFPSDSTEHMRQAWGAAASQIVGQLTMDEAESVLAHLDPVLLEPGAAVRTLLGMHVQTLRNAMAAAEDITDWVVDNEWHAVAGGQQQQEQPAPGAAEKRAFHRPDSRHVLNARTLTPPPGRTAASRGRVLSGSPIEGVLGRPGHPGPLVAAGLAALAHIGHPSASLLSLPVPAPPTPVRTCTPGGDEAVPARARTPAVDADAHARHPRGKPIDESADPVVLSIKLAKLMIAIYKLGGWTAAKPSEDAATFVFRDDKLLEHLREMDLYQSAFRRLVADLDQCHLEPLSEDERLCFFLNIHNVLCMHAFIEMSLPSGFFNRVDVLYNKVVYDIGGNFYSMTDLAHGIIMASQTLPDVPFIIRPLVNFYKLTPDDPRYHLRLTNTDPFVRFLLVDGTVSCGRMVAYQPEMLHEQIKREVQWVLMRAIGVAQRSRVVEVPQIFSWYMSDFAKNQRNAALLKTIVDSFPDLALSKFIMGFPLKNGQPRFDKITVRFTAYHWTFCFRIIDEVSL